MCLSVVLCVWAILEEADPVCIFKKVLSSWNILELFHILEVTQLSGGAKSLIHDSLRKWSVLRQETQALDEQEHNYFL